MQQDLLSKAQLAAKVKEKHPEYADVDDDELVDRIVKKYPTYRSTLQPETGGMDPGFESHVNDILSSLKTRGLNARLSQGYRTPKQQDDFYAQGRTKPGPIVTYATGKTGKHPRGMAADIDLLDANGKPLPSSAKEWAALGEEASKRGLTWGGGWKKLKDLRHVEANGPARMAAQTPATPKPSTTVPAVQPAQVRLPDDPTIDLGQRSTYTPGGTGQVRPRRTYNTSLTPEQEQEFAAWKQKQAPKDSGDDYDLRGAFKAGVVPDPKSGHWPDQFKKPNHPTFSNESQYATGADAAKAGHWKGQKFVRHATPQKHVEQIAATAPPPIKLSARQPQEPQPEAPEPTQPQEQRRPQLSRSQRDLNQSVKNPERLMADIRWHYGIGPDTFAHLKPSEQRRVALGAARASAADEGKKQRGDQLEMSYPYQAKMREAAGLKFNAKPDQPLESRPLSQDSRDPLDTFRTAAQRLGVPEDIEYMPGYNPRTRKVDFRPPKQISPEELKKQIADQSFIQLKSEQERSIQDALTYHPNTAPDKKSDDELRADADKLADERIALEKRRPEIEALKSKFKDFAGDATHKSRMVESVQGALAASGIQLGNLIQGVTLKRRGGDLVDKMRLAQLAIAELDEEDPNKGWVSAAEKAVPGAGFEAAKMVLLSGIPGAGRFTLPGLGALSEADKGIGPAVRGAVEGEIYHRAFAGLSKLPIGKLPKAGLGAAIPAGVAIAQGEDPKKAILTNLAFAAMPLAERSGRSQKAKAETADFDVPVGTIDKPKLIKRVRHSNPNIDGGEIVGTTKSGDLQVENNDGGISIVKHPRKNGNREAAIVTEREAAKQDPAKIDSPEAQINRKREAGLAPDRRWPQRIQENDWLEMSPEERAGVRSQLEAEMGPATHDNGKPIAAKSPKEVIEAAGLQYVGEQEMPKVKPPGQMFNAPDGSTLMILGEVTPEAIAAKLTAHQAKSTKTAVENNASGESAASTEAISRVQSEKTNGRSRVVMDTRSGKATPITGVDAVDRKLGPFEVIIQDGVGPGGVPAVLDAGNKVTSDMRRSALERYRTRQQAESNALTLKPRLPESDVRQAPPKAPAPVSKAVDTVLDSKVVKPKDKIPTAKVIKDFTDQAEQIVTREPNVLIAKRVGDFYEFFGDTNAKRAGKTFDVTVTKRRAQFGDESGEISMAGLPHHSIARYLQAAKEKGIEVRFASGDEPPEAQVEQPKDRTAPEFVNSKKWYHGTSATDLKAEDLDPFFGKHDSLMGQGIYLTDNPDIAKGYAGNKARKKGESTVYEASEGYGDLVAGMLGKFPPGWEKQAAEDAAAEKKPEKYKPEVGHEVFARTEDGEYKRGKVTSTKASGSIVELADGTSDNFKNKDLANVDSIRKGFEEEVSKIENIAKLRAIVKRGGKFATDRIYTDNINKAGGNRTNYRKFKEDYRDPIALEVAKTELAKRRGEAGAVSVDLLTLGIRPFVKEVAEKTKEAVVGAREVSDGLKRLLAPAVRTDASKATANIVRANAAELAREGDIADRTLKAARRFFGGKQPSFSLDFIDRIEQGTAQTNPKLQGFADVMRQMLDERRLSIQALGTGKLATFIQDYFPHIWKDPIKARNKFVEAFAKQPLQGSKNFLKRRSIPLTQDGIAMGLEPVSKNPVDLMLLKMREMDKYLMAHRVLQEMKSQSLVQYVKANHKIPDGWVKINDNVFTVYGGSSAKPQGGTLIRGHYVAPEAAAKVINNYLSAGIRGTWAKVPYEVWRGTSNMLNQFQLGWSAFHAGFTTLDVVVSRTAAGLEDIFTYRKPFRGLKTIASTPVSPLTNLLKGNRMLKEWYDPGSQGAEYGRLVEAMVNAGGRARMDRFYATEMTKKFTDVLREGNILGAAVRSPAALTDLLSKPVMEWLVPRQKMGIFTEMARREIERLGPTASQAQIRDAMAKAWDSVDNRMGQLVYDNLFWHKTTKDLAMASVRSVGWNLGTIREVAGGAKDYLTVPARGVQKLRGRNHDPLFTHKMAYTTALPVVVGMIGAITQYLMSGERPKELKDYFFPRTGNTDENGSPERLSLPSYMKDLYPIIATARTRPSKLPSTLGTMAAHKAHPMISLVAEMLNNEDYYGVKIRNEDDPAVQQLKDSALHVLKSFQPFAFRGLQKERERGTGKAGQILPFIGVTPAPAYVNKSLAETVLDEKLKEQMPDAPRTKAEAERSRLRHQLQKRIRRGQDVRGEIKAGIAAGTLRPDDADAIPRDAKKSPPALRFARLRLKDALDVYQVMTDSERAEVRDVLEKKAERVDDLPKDEAEQLKKRMQAIGLHPSFKMRPREPKTMEKPKKAKGAGWSF